MILISGITEGFAMKALADQRDNRSRDALVRAHSLQAAIQLQDFDRWFEKYRKIR